MIKITVDNIKDYIFAKAMIESFSESEKLYYRLSTEFLNIEDPEVDIIKSENYYKGEDGLKTERTVPYISGAFFWNHFNEGPQVYPSRIAFPVIVSILSEPRSFSIVRTSPAPRLSSCIMALYTGL